MQIRTINSRGTLFTFQTTDWDLNIYLIKGRRYNYIIDTGLGNDCMTAVMNYLEPDDKKTIVINTHYHWDHIWGNTTLKDSVLISHKLSYDMITANWDGMLEKNRRYGFGEVTLRLPDLVFEKEMFFPEDRIRLFHSPGHSSDSISILDEEDQVLIIGDNIGDNMEEIFPNLECDKEIYYDTLKSYLTLDYNTCISGHNTILTRENLETIINRMLTDSSHPF